MHTTPRFASPSSSSSSSFSSSGAPVFHASGGATALVEAAVNEQLGVCHSVGGGKKMMAALSLYSVLQSIFVPVVQAGIEVQHGETVTSKTIGEGWADEWMIVSSGGSAVSTTVERWGRQTVLSGGMADATSVNTYYGSLTVEAGGSATNIAHSNGNIAFGVAGGHSTVVSGSGAHGSFDYSNSGTISGKTLHSGIAMQVLAGGSANDTTVDSWGTQRVYSGGVADATTVTGYLVVDGGGSATNFTLQSGGNLSFDVMGGHSTVVSGSGYFGNLDYSNSGVISGKTLHSGVWMGIYAGGIAHDTLQVLGGYQNIYSGGSAVGTTVARYSDQHVNFGGVADGTILQGSGSIRVSAGGSALNIRQEQGGGIVFDVESGYSTVVSGGGEYGNFDYSNNGTISGVSLLNNVTMRVSAGGRAENTTILAGGSQYLDDTASALHTHIKNGGYQGVSGGGYAGYTSVEYGGSQNVSASGTAEHITVHSGGWLGVDGSALDVVQEYGGAISMEVAPGGAALVRGTNANGQAFSLSGGVAEGFMLFSGASQGISSGGRASHTAIYSGGSQSVSAGGVSTDITLHSGGGFAFAAQGGVTTQARGSGYYGAFDYSNTGTLSNLDLHEGLELTLASGATLAGATVHSGGRLQAGAGGLATGIIQKRGANITSAGGDVSGTNAKGQAFSLSGGRAENCILYAGDLWHVWDTGAFVNTELHYGAALELVAGAKTTSTQVYYGGRELLIEYWGATEAVSTTVHSGGSQIVIAGASASGTHISSGGQLFVTLGSATAVQQEQGGLIEFNVLSGSSGQVLEGSGYYGNFNYNNNGALHNATLHEGVTMHVGNGGEANFATVQSGGQLAVGKGGAASAVMQQSGGGVAFEVGVSGVTLKGSGAYGAFDFSNSGSISGAALHEGVTMQVSAGGLAQNVLVQAGAAQVVNAEGKATGTVQQSGGALSFDVHGGKGTILQGSGHYGAFDYSNTGMIENAVLHEGVTMNLSSGGQAVGTRVGSGAAQMVSLDGAAKGTLVQAGGKQNIFYKGEALGAQIFSGGVQELLGGKAYGAAVFNGGVQAVSYGVATGTTVENGGLQTLGAEGAAKATSILSGGTLRVDSGGMLYGDNIIKEGGVLVAEHVYLEEADTLLRIERHSDEIVATIFNGPGALVKQGRGTLALDAPSTNIGAVEVTEGKLVVGSHAGTTASLAAANGVNVAPGAALGGHGTVRGNVSISGGTLSPGNSYGTTTVDGNLSFAPGSVYEVEVNRANTSEGDLTAVTGAASLAGTLKHVGTGGAAAEYADPNKSWTILTAEKGVSGQFDAAISTLAFLVPELAYLPKSVQLSFRHTPFSEYASTYNQRSVAGALQTLDQSGALYRAIVGATTQNEARRLLDALSGEIHSSLVSNLVALDSSFLRGFSRHTSRVRLLNSPVYEAGSVAAIRSGDFTTASGPEATPQSGQQIGQANGVWVNVGGSYTDTTGDGNAGRTTMRGPEVSGGYDRSFADGWFGGVGFRYSYKDLDLKSRSSEADLNSYTAALYGGKEFLIGPGALRFTATGAYSRHDVESDRTVRIGKEKQALSAEYSADSFMLGLEAGYAFALNESVYLEPFIGGAWHNLHVESLNEKGGSAALHKNGKSYTYGSGTLGLRASVPATKRVRFGGELAWRHAFGPLVPQSDFSFREGSASFTVKGNTASRDELVLGLGGEISLTPAVTLSLSYDGSFGDRGQSHGGSATFSLRW